METSQGSYGNWNRFPQRLPVGPPGFEATLGSSCQKGPQQQSVWLETPTSKHEPPLHTQSWDLKGYTLASTAGWFPSALPNPSLHALLARCAFTIANFKAPEAPNLLPPFFLFLFSSSFLILVLLLKQKFGQLWLFRKFLCSYLYPPCWFFFFFCEPFQHLDEKSDDICMSLLV